jgi:hypothetical protein
VTPTTTLLFCSTALTPSGSRFVANSPLDIQMPFFVYPISSAGGGFETSLTTVLMKTQFALSGQSFNLVDVTLRDAQSNAVLTTMSDWQMVLEFDV